MTARPGMTLNEVAEGAGFLRYTANALSNRRIWQSAFYGEDWEDVSKALDAIATAKAVCIKAADALDGRKARIVQGIDRGAVQ